MTTATSPRIAVPAVVPGQGKPPRTNAVRKVAAPATVHSEPTPPQAEVKVISLLRGWMPDADTSPRVAAGGLLYLYDGTKVVLVADGLPLTKELVQRLCDQLEDKQVLVGLAMYCRYRGEGEIPLEHIVKAANWVIRKGAAHAVRQSHHKRPTEWESGKRVEYTHYNPPHTAEQYPFMEPGAVRDCFPSEG